MKKTRVKWGRLACFLLIITAISGTLLWFGGKPKRVCSTMRSSKAALVSAATRFSFFVRDY